MVRSVRRPQSGNSGLISTGRLGRGFRLNTYSDSIGPGGVRGEPNLIRSSCAAIKRRGAVLKLTAVHPAAVTFKDLDVPAGDLTVFVDMQAQYPLEGFTADTFVPRRADVSFSKLPSYGEGPRNDSYSRLGCSVHTGGKKL